MKKFLFFAFTVALSAYTFQTNLNAAAAAVYEPAEVVLLVFNNCELPPVTAANCVEIYEMLDKNISQAIVQHAITLASYCGEPDIVYQKIIVPASKFQDHLHVKAPKVYPKPIQVDLVYFYLYKLLVQTKQFEAAETIDNLHKTSRTKFLEAGKTCTTRKQALDLVKEWRNDICTQTQEILHTLFN
ncbi:hypothetical protein K2X40_02120 [Candidatus Babeliales bacterium]|nr:hypothetical protein [Candidatus Babeliales bacterium]